MDLRPRLVGTLAALLVGCSGTQPVATAPVGQSDVSADESPEKALAPAGSAELSMGSHELGNAIVSYPSFQVLEDGRSLISLELRGPIRVVEQAAEGALVYSLVGITIPEPVNQLPLPNEFFETPVSAVEVRQAAQGAELVISLRKQTRGVLSLRQSDGGALLTVEVPRSSTEAGLAPRRVSPPQVKRSEETQDGGDSWNGNLSRSIVGPRSPGLIVLGASMTALGIAGLSVGAYFLSQNTPACDRLLEGFTLVQEDPVAAAEEYELSDLQYDDCESEIIVLGAGAVSLATGAAFFLAGVPVLLVGAIPTEKTIKLGLRVYPAGAGLLIGF